MIAQRTLLLVSTLLATVAACGSDEDDGEGGATFECGDTTCLVSDELCMERADGSGQCASASACDGELECECATTAAEEDGSCTSTGCSSVSIEGATQLTVVCAP